MFVKGDLKGQVTVAAENFVYATGDIKYEDDSRDMLGLVGNNAVLVWNPMNTSNDNMLTDSSRRIDAAILSVAHTFQVQNYDRGGNRGTLTINGAIAQKFRGIVRSRQQRVRQELRLRPAIPVHRPAEVPVAGDHDLRRERLVRDPAGLRRDRRVPVSRGVARSGRH